MSRPIRIHLDEVHLYGVDPRDRHAVADALASELRRQVAELGLPAHLSTPGETLKRSVQLAPGATHGPSLGTAVAGAIVGNGAPRRGTK